MPKQRSVTRIGFPWIDSRPSRVRALGFVLSLATASAAILSAPVASAGEEDSWFTRKHGTGDWAGLRQTWLEDGVVPGGFYVFDILGNPTGGLDQDTAYAGFAQFDLSLNLNRLLGAKGLAFNMAFSWSSGTNLSASIGNVFQVAEAYSGQTVQLSRLYLEQTMADSRLFLKFGRVSAANDFAILPVNVYHLNAAVNGNPLSIGLNSPGFFADPVGQWGIRLLYAPSDRLRFRVGVYNADPAVGEPSKHGLDFRFNPEDGVLSMVEAGFNPRLSIGGEEYRGRYKAGVYFDSSSYGFIEDPLQMRDGQYGFYLMGQQEVFHKAGDPTEIEFRPFFGRHIIRTEATIDSPISRQSLIPWFVVAVSPREEISPMPLYVAGGAIYRGLFKYRGKDKAAVAICYGRFSSRYRERKSETVIELNYGIQGTPWFYLTPTVQYVFNPGGIDIPNALVLGVEVGITF